MSLNSPQANQVRSEVAYQIAHTASKHRSPNRFDWETALHESGHAVVAEYLKHSEVLEVSIVPSVCNGVKFMGITDSYIFAIPEGLSKRAYRQARMAQAACEIQVDLAGSFAIEVYTNSDQLIPLTSAVDINSVCETLNDIYSPKTHTRARRKFLDAQITRTFEILDIPEIKEAIHVMANVLMTKRVIFGDECRAICKPFFDSFIALNHQPTPLNT